jgi:non-ribosomal peptide synthetase component F
MKLDTAMASDRRLASRALDREGSRPTRIAPQVECIHRWFEEQVERTPDRIAAEFESRQLTYRELNRRANRLARHLESLGVEREEPVGICVDRGLEMLVGVLAILKAGAAYVPMDPAFPTERLAHMLQDSSARVLLTQSHFPWSQRDSANGSAGPALRSNRTDFQTVLLDQDEPLISRHPDGNSTVAVSRDGRAQVIFTSGSTGRPKGVEITHRSLVNFLCAMAEEPGFSADDVLLELAARVSARIARRITALGDTPAVAAEASTPPSVMMTRSAR